MNTLSGMRLAPGPRGKRVFEREAADEESLLVAFLSELIYLEEQENMGFDAFELKLRTQHMHVEMEGSSILSLEKPIKAVTFHNLNIVRTPHGCEAEIVFDV